MKYSFIDLKGKKEITKENDLETFLYSKLSKNQDWNKIRKLHDYEKQYNNIKVNRYEMIKNICQYGQHTV
tara:strand:- start:2694 stop:2903 length:210 start_codon:yes stop_codon:yes gene_type:complete